MHCDTIIFDVAIKINFTVSTIHRPVQATDLAKLLTLFYCMKYALIAFPLFIVNYFLLSSYITWSWERLKFKSFLPYFLNGSYYTLFLWIFKHKIREAVQADRQTQLTLSVKVSFTRTQSLKKGRC